MALHNMVERPDGLTQNGGMINSLPQNGRVSHGLTQNGRVTAQTHKMVE